MPQPTGPSASVVPLLGHLGTRIEDEVGRYAFDVHGIPIEVKEQTDDPAEPVVLRSNYYLIGAKPDVAIGNCPFEIRAIREPDGDTYTLELTSFSQNEKWAYATADFIRQHIIAWRER